MSHPPTRKLGELLVGCGLLTQAQLRAALSDQFCDPEERRLGELLVRNGWVTGQSVDYFLAAQKQGLVQEGEPIGLHLVLAGLITQEMLEQALDVQQTQGGRLGEVLERLQYCPKAVVDFFFENVFETSAVN